MTFTEYPCFLKKSTLRDNGVGSVSFSRAEGEIKAMVSPDFSGGGVISGKAIVTLRLEGRRIS